MVNGKLKYPFINFGNINELKPISAIDVKQELSKKFYKEIDINNIYNFGYKKQNQFLLSHPEYLVNKENKIIKHPNNINNSFEINENEGYLNNNNEPIGYFYNLNNISDISQITQKNNSIDSDENILNKENNLIYIIGKLENKVIENDKLVENQSNEINKLSNILDNMINNI